MAAYMEARSSALSHASAVVRLLAARDHLHAETKLHERELEIFRCMTPRVPISSSYHLKVLEPVFEGFVAPLFPDLAFPYGARSVEVEDDAARLLCTNLE